MPMEITRARSWSWYALVWVPIALLHSLNIAATSPIPISQAAIAGATYVIPVALLGVAVWWLTGVLDWPPRNKPLFILVHIAAAILLSAIWLGVEVGSMALGMGAYAAIVLAKTFAGFQAVDGVIVYALIAAGSYVIRIAARLREQEARTARADSLRMQAELAALRGQLNPHFLFNTLHTLTALVRRDPDTAENALERFGDMLRYVLDVKRSAREDVTVADEMHFVRNYLSLEQLRLGDRLRVVEQIDPDALDCVLPSLTLQPLVENAIKYGIAPRAAGGTLTIGASLDDESLTLEVRDDGPGAPSDVIDGASGVGLRAVRQRLETRYPGQARFAVTTAPREGFAVRLGLPATTGSETPRQPATLHA
ncbi:MAG: two-component histidine kinase [Gemmatimonadetes bacterium]|nr:two-component histidine kinase [Gemmatimonadota bacterium]